ARRPTRARRRSHTGLRGGTRHETSHGRVMNMLPRHVSSRRAAEILRAVFQPVVAGFAFRLWDGTLVPLGHGAPACTAVVHHPETFVRLMRTPTPLNFAEAYVDVDPEKYPLTIQPFTACRFRFAGASHETRWHRPASYGIVRSEFDRHLLERARAAGADVRDGARVTAVTRDGAGVRVVSER